MQATHCPVCGYGPFDPPYNSYQDLGNSYDICPACFCEYGFDDSRFYRERWFVEGRRWRTSAQQPIDWKPEELLPNAIEGWMGTTCGYARSQDYETRYQPNIDQWLDWLNGAEVKRRLTAVIILGGLEDIRVEAALASALDDPDEDIRFFAQHAIDGRRIYREAGLRST